MADKTQIEWADASWPVVQGCSIVSAGCKNCYAVNVVNRLAGNPRVNRDGILDDVVAKNSRGRTYWTGKVALRHDRLDWPLKWTKGRKIFVPSHGDLFHEDVPEAFIWAVFMVMSNCPQHIFQILTKRADRMAYWFAKHDPATGFDGNLRHTWPLSNVWLGVSVEDQRSADLRIPLLRKIPAKTRFVSYEPALRMVDFSQAIDPFAAWDGFTRAAIDGGLFNSDQTDSMRWPVIDQIIVGGESGPRARPCIGGIENAMRSTVEQCAAAGVAPFVKQMGSVWAKSHEHGPECVSRMDPRGWPQQHLDLKGGDMEHWPEDLRVREYPAIEEAVTV